MRFFLSHVQFMDERSVPEYDVDVLYEGIEQETQKYVLENQAKEASEIEVHYSFGSPSSYIINYNLQILQ